MKLVIGLYPTCVQYDLQELLEGSEAAITFLSLSVSPQENRDIYNR